ncbi:MAG: hypothetical protein DRP47_00745 [Candidatus Zixiibacteriota bacterium]|nr:MAG: hypothetical protein DRP47_00745 [candidate division Zixibacteria bacterium]
MGIFDKLMKLDRRWVFLLLAVVCVWSYVVPFDIPIRTEPESEAIYSFIDSLPPGDIVFIAIDYDPNNLAELHPMTYAVVEHCWRKELKVIFTALSQNGPGMADQAIRDISDSLLVDKVYNGVEFKGREIIRGKDYCFLGYKPYYALIILGMGQDFRLPFPTDYYGTPLDSVEMMKGVINYDQVACVIDLSGGSITDAWISYGQGRFNFPLALGLTGVMTAQYYPYLGSGQIFGIMGGLLGAAQYEEMADNPGRAKEGMRVQLFAHLVIIFFIVVGNIGYFVTRYRQKKQKEVS